MKAVSIYKTVACILSKYAKKLLTVSRPSVHTSFNTPAKPMLFSNSMLKLSGLFFACHIPTAKYNTNINSPSFKAPPLEGGLYDYVY